MAEFTGTHPGVDSEVARVTELLREARERTLSLIEPLSDEDLRIQHDPLMSPIVWDLGHIAHFEELWLTRNVHGTVEFGEMPGIYNPFEHPRRVRGTLDLPGHDEVAEILSEIRERVLRKLETLDLEAGDPLLRDGYVYAMVAQHEYQHNETILQTLQLKRGEPYRAPRRVVLPEPTVVFEPGAMVRFPGGRVPIGTNDRRVAYDNERPRHLVDLAPFRIDVTPVTNGQYLEFIEDGGYARRELWTDAGWAWREADGAVAPKYWQRDGATWTARVFDRRGPIDPRRPVCHVSFHEAEAFARWAGKRLPTEFEWEAAASHDPASDTRRELPWGDDPWTPTLANLDQLAFDTAPVGAYPRNVSPLGCYGMIGDVWEWTSSDFGGYPGYETFPYAEYSEVFFGTEYKVLRGGSFATRPGAIRNTFRNWDYPIRRQIFSGFRCASDD
ncbi:MAG TPA: ergothioneine biosynthesis protein EgtB [Gemmatimonadaceae bacterium]|nr:ergothioneine biosynthesis protein EgtB [Gemmatimonadaceae bacterium]